MSITLGMKTPDMKNPNPDPSTEGMNIKEEKAAKLIETKEMTKDQMKVDLTTTTKDNLEDLLTTEGMEREAPVR